MKKVAVALFFSALILFGNDAHFTFHIPIDIDPVPIGAIAVLNSGKEVKTDGKIYIVCKMSGEDGADTIIRKEIRPGKYLYHLKVTLPKDKDPLKINRYNCRLEVGVEDEPPMSPSIFFSNSSLKKRNFQVIGIIE